MAPGSLFDELSAWRRTFGFQHHELRFRHVDAHGGQGAAPYAAGVDGVNTEAVDESVDEHANGHHQPNQDYHAEEGRRRV